jgi:DNA-binding NtrC family response regulator
MRAGSKEDKQSLLVVDDDPVFRDLEAQVLSHAGYEVLLADGAAEALRLANSTDTIDLLLTDFRMPETNGLELTQQFRAAHPETPVLLISGEQPSLQNFPDAPEFLAKPFTLSQLVQKVRYLLATSAARIPEARAA